MCHSCEMMSLQTPALRYDPTDFIHIHAADISKLINVFDVFADDLSVISDTTGYRLTSMHMSPSGVTPVLCS